MTERLITEECYRKIKDLYITEGFILYEFPIRYIPEVELCDGYTLRSIAIHDDTIPTPPEVDGMWDYILDDWVYEE